jgi:nicotinamide riboside transporter PnuC
MTGGAICLSFAFLSLTLQHLFSRLSSPYFYLDAFGMTLSIAGIILMVLGLRSHYFVWTRKISSRAPRPILVSEEDRHRTD